MAQVAEVRVEGVRKPLPVADIPIADVSVAAEVPVHELPVRGAIDPTLVAEPQVSEPLDVAPDLSAQPDVVDAAPPVAADVVDATEPAAQLAAEHTDPSSDTADALAIGLPVRGGPIAPAMVPERGGPIDPATMDAPAGDWLAAPEPEDVDSSPPSAATEPPMHGDLPVRGAPIAAALPVSESPVLGVSSAADLPVDKATGASAPVETAAANEAAIVAPEATTEPEVARPAGAIEWLTAPVTPHDAGEQTDGPKVVVKPKRQSTKLLLAGAVLVCIGLALLLMAIAANA